MKTVVTAYHKQRQCIHGQTHGVETQAVEPDLRVFERVQNRRPGEPLVADGIRVIFQAELDEFTLFI